MERDERVFVLGEDVGVYGGAFKATEGLLERFGPARVLDTPLAEEAIVGAAIGAAMRGLRPVAEMQFIDFISRAFDLLTNFAAKNRYRTGIGVPLVVRGPSGAGVHGGPYHSQTPEMYFVKTPGLKVVAPATAADAQGAPQGRDPRRRPGHLPRAQVPLPARARPAGPRRGRRRPLGKAAVRRPGTGPHDRDVRRDALDRARGRARARGGRHLARDPRPPHAPAAGTRTPS